MVRLFGMLFKVVLLLLLPFTTKFITESFYTVTILPGDGAVIFSGVTAECPTGAVVPVLFELVLFTI